MNAIYECNNFIPCKLSKLYPLTVYSVIDLTQTYILYMEKDLTHKKKIKTKSWDSKRIDQGLPLSKYGFGSFVRDITYVAGRLAQQTPSLLAKIPIRFPPLPLGGFSLHLKHSVTLRLSSSASHIQVLYGL